MHYRNEPVNSSWTSALGTLAATAKPSDYVVLKLDIDTPKLEHELLQMIAGTPSLADVVDELFFEYHVQYFDGKVKEQANPIYSNETVPEAIAFMQQLRRLGIRSHLWV